MSHASGNLMNVASFGLTGMSFPGVFGSHSGMPGAPASARMAALDRAQWEDYKARFIPQEDKLISIANNPQQFVKDQNTLAMKGLQNANDNALPQINRQYSQFGLNYTPSQETEIQRRLSLNQGLSSVQALNTSTRGANDQLLGLMGGGLVQGNRS